MSMLQLPKSSCPRAGALQQETSPQSEAHTPHEGSPYSLQLEKSPCSSEDPAQPKINKNYLKNEKIIQHYNLLKILYD